MFENIINFFKKFGKNQSKEASGSKNKAKERLHLVLMQDRANVSADFLELMKQEIIDVIKKYIEVDEKEIDVRLTNEVNEDGTAGAPSLYANIPISNIKYEMKKEAEKSKNEDKPKEDIKENNEEDKSKIKDEETINEDSENNDNKTEEESNLEEKSE